MKKLYKYINRDTSGIAISSVYIGNQSFHEFYDQLSFFQYSKKLYGCSEGDWHEICRQSNGRYLKLHLIMSLRANKTFIEGNYR